MPVIATHTTRSESETSDLGRATAASFVPGTTVLLLGDLGAGKTAFVRGLAEGLGVDPAEVSSPTFALIQEYRGGRLPLFHVDLFRLDHEREVEELGLDELTVEGVLAVEWAEKLPRVPPGSISVRIETVDANTRRIQIAR
jgi:tRNA threonylcarbamoyladenosine biosynthesis protein TsaE